MHIISLTNTNTMYSRQKYYWWPKMQNVTKKYCHSNIGPLYISLFKAIALPIILFALFFASVCMFLHGYRSFSLSPLRLRKSENYRYRDI